MESQKSNTSIPESATAIQAASSSSPTIMIGTSPNLRIRKPVTTPGANIANMCEAMTPAVESKL